MANQFVPLIILIVLSCIGAFVGYAIYTVANDVADKTQKKMEQKNVMFSKDGMRVGVKELKTEDYVEQTQRYVGLGVTFLGESGGRLGIEYLGIEIVWGRRMVL